MEGKTQKTINIKRMATNLLWFLVFIFVSFCVLPRAASAASLYFSPSYGSYKVGQQFSVGVYVGSADQAMNAAEGSVSFYEDKLSVVSISKSGSIINLWAQEPSFSNSAGTIDFAGIVLNPGYTGSAGKILTVTFKAKMKGDAILNFSSASVLANDGAGTNIFTGAGVATFNISAGATAEEAPPVTSEGGAPSAATTGSATKNVPSAPKVTSETHPDPTKWYLDNNPSFDWALTKDITGVNVLADRNPNSNPGTKSDGMRTSYTFKDVDEGEWYFHIRLRNSVGWGAITHFGFNIDTEAPMALEAYFTDTDELNTHPTIRLSATDTMSGIDYYEIYSYSNGASSTWRDDGTGQYQLDTLPAGSHKINITAYDKARNSVSTELFRNVVLPPEAPKVPEVVSVSVWDELYAWLKLNILWIIIIFLIILLIIILIYDTIYLRKLFTPPKKISRKKWSAYTTRRKIEALQNELQWHAEAIGAASEKRRLRWKERCLRWQYRKLVQRTKKYLDKIPK